jgi:hypothetical protein
MAPPGASSGSTPPDPAARGASMRRFSRDWRPTRLGRWVNRLQCWWSGLGRLLEQALIGGETLTFDALFTQTSVAEAREYYASHPAALFRRLGLTPARL